MSRSRNPAATMTPSPAADRAKAVLLASRRAVNDAVHAWYNSSDDKDPYDYVAAAGLRIEAEGQTVWSEQAQAWIPFGSVIEPPATPQDSPQRQEIAALVEARQQLFALCEATANDCDLIAARDTETKVGAFARGRIKEAKSIRDAMGEVFHALTAALRQPRQVSAEAETEVAALHHRCEVLDAQLEATALALHTAERERDRYRQNDKSQMERAIIAEKRSEAADARAKGLEAALSLAQWDCRGRCPVCAGWNVGPYGETDKVHTKDCPVGVALAVAKPETDNG